MKTRRTRSRLLSIDGLFRFVSDTPETVIDDLLKVDEFLFEMRDLTSQSIKHRRPDIDIAYVRGAVNKIDDSGYIESQAFREGFLFGMEYAKRQERAR